ncbi:acyl-CoA thioesterase-2 [Rhodococcus sp. SMB37]|nr:acyl-CoA thioesterase-2 [Rhodococcus sp. SMB37]
MQAAFVAQGEAGKPIDYIVNPVHVGTRLNRWAVTAAQRDTPIFTCSVSTQRPSGEYVDGSAMPEVAPAELLPNAFDVFGDGTRPAEFGAAAELFDVRYAAPSPWEHFARGQRAMFAQAWFRPVAALPDDPAMQYSALAYASDMTVFDSVLTSRGLCWGHGRMVIAAIEANISFHGPVRFDDWLLYVTECGVQAGDRAGVTGRFFDMSGRVVASTSYECFIRVFRAGATPRP